MTARKVQLQCSQNHEHFSAGPGRSRGFRDEGWGLLIPTYMSDELTVKEAALAWAQGKRVEAKPWTDLLGCEWSMIIPVRGGDGHYNAIVFSNPHNERYIFRLAPESPAKKWRPWKPEEVPVGALIRFAPVVSSHCWMITGWNESGFGTSNEQFRHIRFEEAMRDLHSTDNGKTWLPCGVEVEA